MADDAHGSHPPGGEAPIEGRLDSWKEIAAYLGRGIRTVQRWEREEGLPVHRLVHGKRGSIYARRDEIAGWWESRRRTLAAPSASDADSAATSPRLERVTRTSAMTSWPALSSDARLIAYVSDDGQDGATPQIWVQQIGGAAMRLTNEEREYSHLAFSPDNTRILFTVVDESGPKVCELPTLGGEPRVLQPGASRGQVSPDGRCLVCIPRAGAGVRVVVRNGVGVRTVAPELVDVACTTWSPDSRCVIVHARAHPAIEPDWWVVPIEHGPPVDTGLVSRLFREAGLFTIPTGVAWVDDSLVFSAAGAQGVSLYRQRIIPSTFQPTGAAEKLTAGSEAAWFPTAAAGRLAFLSCQADANLWSVALDAASGVAHGPLRRMTRGPSPTGYLSVTSDFQTLAYFSYRRGEGDVFLRDLSGGSERAVVEGPTGPKGYPAISPAGRRLAYGTRVPGGDRSLRPIFVVDLADGTSRSLGDDCGGRPRAWIDERTLLIERFARLNSIALLDAETGAQRDLLASAERSITNPRLSSDRRWVAFDASRPGEPVSVFVAPFAAQRIRESDWKLVETSASHPCWSANGHLLYYTPVGTNPMVRASIRARHVTADGSVAGESIPVFASNELLMPAYLPGTAPIATPDQMVLVLGDFRGDVWVMDFVEAARA
jgi:Tol biopolymer transport system component